MFRNMKKGKKDEFRPYEGYKVVYGSMTLEAIKSAGYVPLTCRLTFPTSWSYSYSGRLAVKVNGTAIFNTQFYGDSEDYIYFHSRILYVDLDYHLGGNIEKLKNVTLSGTSLSAQEIVKWLEPLE